MKVKKSLLAIIMVSVGFFLSGNKCFSVEPSLFHSQTYDYSLTIPDGWRQIPQTIVDEGLNRATSSDSKRKFIYDVAFQRNSAERWFQTPYVMVQVIKLHRQIHEDEFEKFIKKFSGIELTVLAKEALNSEALNLLTNIATGKVYLDRDNRLFLYNLESNVANVGKVRGKRVGHFGCQTLIIVSFYDTVRNWNESKFDRDLILKSFCFDPSMAYNDSYKKKGLINLPNAFVGGLKELILTFFFVVIGLGFVIFSRLRKKRKTKLDRDNNKSL